MKAAPRNRFLRLLRRTTGAAQRQGARSAAEENALWLAHERALTHARVVQEATQKIAASAAKQRGSLEGLADAGRTLAAHVHELERQSARSVDVFERLSIVALNASLEATRLGEAQGRSLALVSDEVRLHAMRGGEAARALVHAAHDLTEEANGFATKLGDARATESTSESQRAETAAREVEAALTEMQERLRKATGSDPETARAIGQAAEHARALVGALATLRGRVPQNLLVGVLSPLLEPLLRALDDGSEEEK